MEGTNNAPHCNVMWILHWRFWIASPSAKYAYHTHSIVHIANPHAWIKKHSDREKLWSSQDLIRKKALFVKSLSHPERSSSKAFQNISSKKKKKNTHFVLRLTIYDSLWQQSLVLLLQLPKEIAPLWQVGRTRSEMYTSSFKGVILCSSKWTTEEGKKASCKQTCSSN